MLNLITNMKCLKLKIVWGVENDNWAQIAMLELVTADSNCTTFATVDGVSYEYVWVGTFNNWDWNTAHDKCANLDDGSYQLPVPTSDIHNQWLLGFSYSDLIPLGITDVTIEGTFRNHYTGKCG